MALGPLDVRPMSMQCTHSLAKRINLGLLLLFGILRLRTRLQRLESLPTFYLAPADVMRNPSSRRTGACGLVAGDPADEEEVLRPR